jgi:hypothetical protein
MLTSVLNAPGLHVSLQSARRTNTGSSFASTIPYKIGGLILCSYISFQVFVNDFLAFVKTFAEVSEKPPLSKFPEIVSLSIYMIIYPTAIVFRD